MSNRTLRLKAGDYIKLPDNRTGTVCWHNLDGVGGIFGFHPELKELANCGFDDRFPCPEFMLREKSVERLLQGNNPEKGIECVGEEFERMGE